MKPWQEIVGDVRQYRDASIAAIQPEIPVLPESLPANVTSLPRMLLSESEVQITEKTAEELLQLLASGELSCVQVTSAFLRRAGIAQKLVNCVTEVLPEAALTRAKELDQYLADNGRPVGPLHGLPISVKEQVSMKGLATNCGYVAWHDRMAQANAHALQLLWNAGAVFYVRTTEPQALMQLETATNLYGVTVNPYNSALTCGGSSGGEGALLGLRGSCLGVGTDIGGSVRAPAANCGIWSFRPSTYRVPYIGTTAPGLQLEGDEQIIPVMGPMSTSFEGLHLFMKTILDQKPWLVEPSLLPLPWNYPPRESSFIKPDGKKRLKVGIMWHDNVVRPHPPITRALNLVAKSLQKLPDRFEIVDWIPLKHDEAWEIISALYFTDGGKAYKDIAALTNEPWLPLNRFVMDDQPNVREYTISEVWALTFKREIYRYEYAAHWNATGTTHNDTVDVIVCPVGPGAAPPLGCSRYWPYTSTWNLLDYPAMVFPVTQVDERIDGDGQGEHEHRPMTEQDAQNWKLWTDGGAQRYKDAPVNLQLVGRRWHDERVFEAMAMIKEALTT